MTKNKQSLILANARNKLPSFLQSALWSYDLAKFNLHDPNDQRLIANNVLNHGTDQQIRWLLKNYSADIIKEALTKPDRGFWWPESLNYWTQVFNVQLTKKTYERALQNINPQA